MRAGLTTRRRVIARARRGALALASVAAVLVSVSPPAAASTYRVELVNFSTNLRADVMWASQQDGQGVFLWPNNTSASQEFDLIATGGGYFQIRARHSGKCLMLDRGQPKVGNGTAIRQYPCLGAGYQSEQWSFRDMNGGCADTALCADTGRRVVVNRYTGRCIDTANPSGRRPGQEAVLQQWTCITSPSAWNADNQIWKLYDPVNRRIIYRPV